MATQPELHFSITATNEDLKRKLAESRQAILDSGKTAEATASRIDGSFKRMALAAGAFLTAQQAISLGGDIIRVRGEIQMMEQSFEVLLQSKSKATKMIAEIKRLAIDSPLEMPQVSGAVQTLLGFGVEAEKVMGIVGQLSDVSMGNADRFRSLALVYAQCQSAGKLMGQDLLQMINAGFNPLQIISEQTGKSIAQLKDEMSKGAISADMVAAAFEKVTSVGGKFYQMTQKQADGIVGLQATLEDAITEQLNRYGEKNEELIESGYKFATSVVENSDKIVSALIPIVAAYGVYKASIIAVNAIERVNASVQYAAEIAELKKLLPAKQVSANADIEQAVAKGRLSQATAERLITIRAEVQAELANLFAKEKIAQAELAAAIRAHKSALQRSIAARQNMALAQSQMQIAIRGGSVEEIAAAKTAARTAKLEVNSAAIAVNTTQQAVGVAQTNASSAATAVDTMQTNINTVSTNAGTTAKNLFTAATGRLTKAFRLLGSAIKGNPIGMVLTGVTMAISLFSTFGNSTKDAADAQEALNKSISDCGIAIAKESQELDNAFARLIKAKKGTKEYGDAKDNILSNYGKYLEGLSSEVRSLNNVAGAYVEVKKAAEESLKARFKAEFIESANKDAAAKMGEAMSKIMQGVNNSFSDDFKQQFPEQMTAINAQITATLTDATKTMRDKKIEVGAILEDFGINTSHVTRLIHHYDLFGNITGSFVKDYEDSFRNMLNTNNIADDAFKSMTLSQIEASENLETVLERRRSITKQLSEETAILNKMTADNSISTDVEIDAQKKKVESLKQSLGLGKYAPKDIDSDIIDSMLRLEQMKISVMQQGRIKELAQIELTRKEKLAALDKEQKELAKKQGKPLSTEQAAGLNTERTLVGVEATKGTASINKKYDDEIAGHWKALTAVFLSEEQKRTGAIKDRYDKERKWADEVFDKNMPGMMPLNMMFKMKIDATENEEQTKVYQEQLKNYEAFTSEYISKAEEFDGRIKDMQNNGASLDEIANISSVQNEILAKLESEMNAKSETFTVFAKQVVDSGLEELLQMLELAQSSLEAAKSNGLSDGADVEGMKTQISFLQQRILALTAKKGEKVTGDPTKKWKDTLSVMNDVKQLTSDVIGNFDGLDDTTKIVLDSAMNIATGVINMIIGITTLAAGSAVATTTVATTASAAIRAVETASVILAIISAAIQITMAIANALKSVFNDDKSRKQEIERLQGQIDSLQKSYDLLGKAIEKAYSTDASQLLEQSNELLEKQKQLIRLQIAEEESKKNSDGGQIESWKKQLEELDHEIEENKEKAIDVIFGADVKSAIDDFASAYMDAWSSGEDRAQAQKDVVKKMLRNIIQEMLKTDIGKQVEIMREKIAGFMSDDKLDDSELAAIDSMGDEIGKIMEERGKMYDKILKDNSSTQNEQTLAGQIKGNMATEASVDELGGMLRGQNDSLVSIDNRLAIGFQNLVALAKTNAMIEANTRATAANTAQTVTTLASGFTAMQTELTAINKNTTKDTGSYGS